MKANRKELTEPRTVMGGCASPAADDYLDFKTPPHEPETNATIGNELIFLMADILPPRFLMLQGGAGYLPPWAIKKI